MEFSLSNDVVVAAVAVAAAYVVYSYLSTPATPTHAPVSKAPSKEKPTGEPEVPQQRYFTLDELREFNGEGDKPIYIAIKGVVYDVSRRRDFYGPGEGYHLFAGREAARALAKMSFEPADLDNTDISDLNFMEKEILKDWVDKFTDYNSYPIVGRVLQQKDLTLDELSAYTVLPVYVALRGVIYDVTLGGLEHYGPNGGYKMFAGRDATRALALMSFDQENLDHPTEEGLTETQIKTLADWEAKFQSKYRVVGKVVASS
ncbi:hypothetical protein H310_02762 [Aphanomyces invadans]|uniref:Cytochrome b5 heme-binding domain-containing protein n=1 Tax=Aphanomyces invadans TaxID=157072 RepID=A0A024ULQ0_9STRA|nr:hypothetical protein H310_02762 [Aphanomyces invadans]ETW06533.1 hypothetical protein H310_02762 [Aphanomyces invadans]|eukprot:XP_008864608.1 hypothetical protein H310_02762 [Aphanomyces invadans]